MLSRRGFTLIELVVSLFVLGLVGIATTRVLRSLFNASGAQIAIANTQGVMRTAALALPQDLREIGYDTIPATGAVDSDLLSIGHRRLTFRAMRGLGITCGTPTLTEFRIRAPAIGLRDPQPTDGFLLFLESDPNLAADDQWVPLSVASIDYASSCGGEPAIALHLAAPPIVNPAASQPMALSQHFVGGPVRWFERIEYGPHRDPSSGQAYLGVRSVSLGQTELSPLIGPFPDTTSFLFEYIGTGGPISPPGPPSAVRTVVLVLNGQTEPVSLAGGSDRSAVPSVVVARVALRNALRP